MALIINGTIFRARDFQDKVWEIIEWSTEGKQDLLLRDEEGRETRDWLKNLDIIEEDYAE